MSDAEKYAKTNLSKELAELSKLPRATAVESEVLFAPNRKFEVLDIDQKGSLFIIYLDER